MKMLVTLIGSLFALTAFAAEPAKKDEKKAAPAAPAKSAPAAPAKSAPAAAPAKSEQKPAAKAEDKKTETTKK